jgi:hypothetical protein
VPQGQLAAVGIKKGQPRARSANVSCQDHFSGFSPDIRFNVLLGKRIPGPFIATSLCLRRRLAHHVSNADTRETEPQLYSWIGAPVSARFAAPQIMNSFRGLSSPRIEPIEPIEPV